MDGWFIGGVALGVLSLVCPLLPFVYVLNARHGWWTQPFESRIRVRIESASEHGLNAGRTYDRLCAQFTSHHVNRVLRDLACHDPVVPFDMGERLARAIPGALFVPVPHGGHDYQYGRGRWIFRLIADFIRS